jgi:hypothetical protein
MTNWEECGRNQPQAILTGYAYRDHEKYKKLRTTSRLAAMRI